MFFFLLIANSFAPGASGTSSTTQKSSLLFKTSKLKFPPGVKGVTGVLGFSDGSALGAYISPG